MSACSTNPTRVIKMGIVYGDVQLLCTKAIDAIAYKELESKNIFVDIKPFIGILPLANNYLFDKTEQLAQQKITAIFTSANAVKATANLLNKTAVNWDIACLDKATNFAVQEYFPNNKIICTAKDGEALAEALVKLNYASAPAVFFCGNKRLDTLPFMFKAHQLSLEEVMVYQTQMKSQPIEKHYHGILFFSPSAVDSFFVLNEFPKNTVAFCIGQTTADALTKKLNHPAIVVQAAEHSVESLLEAAIVYFNR